MDKILITLVGYKAYAFARLAIESILANTDEEFDLFIINNAPNDKFTSDYYKELQEIHPNVYVKTNPCNLGIAAPWNMALDAMFSNPEYKWISLFHTDIVLNKNWASKIKEAFRTHPEYVGFAPVEINTTETEYLTMPILTRSRHLYKYFCNHYLEDFEALSSIFQKMYDGNFEAKATYYEDQLKDKIIEGAGFSAVTFKKEAFEKVGYFDEVFKCGTEDSDFTMRMSKLGLKTAKTGNSFAHHFCSVTFIKMIEIDGSQEAIKGKQTLLDKTTSTFEKTCLKHTCKHNNSGGCLLGYTCLNPLASCPLYLLEVTK